MLCPKFLQEVPEGPINEMGPSVTYDHFWSPEAWEDDHMKHLAGMLGIGNQIKHLQGLCIAVMSNGSC